jgi:hypothetical protein
MKPTINKMAVINSILVLLLSLSWVQVQGCEITQDEYGRYIFRDCYLKKDQPKIKMADLEVASATISLAAGSGTGFYIDYTITNTGSADTDSGLIFNSGYSIGGGTSKGFDVESTVYVVSEDLSLNLHYDEVTAQWMPYTQQDHRITRLAAADRQSFSYGRPGLPRFYLHDRNMTYKIGLTIKVDEPQTRTGSTRGMTHGEIVESDEFNNNRSIECLVYGNNISDLSEILSVRHFHINNDLNLPMISPCH